jgi:hypothetical protein
MVRKYYLHHQNQNYKAINLRQRNLVILMAKRTKTGLESNEEKAEVNGKAHPMNTKSFGMVCGYNR